MPHQELIPHLFRTEFRKIVSVLCKRMGLEHMEVAEDITSDTFLSAVETWSFKGIPENPVAWLYTVARNKARNHIMRDRIFSEKVSDVVRNAASNSQEHFLDLSEENITDSQLRMLFALCHPSIATEAQIGLALRILCGFGIDEIATAFLTSKETINKRLFRAREKLRSERVQLDFPGESEITKRLETVLTTLYLLFNEGYYSESQDVVLREDLCLEAMRLTYLLIENELTSQSKVKALFALMCFHASRFAARKGEQGELILYADQDESRWNQALIGKGVYYLHEASSGHELSRYHLEASIAYWNTIKTDTQEKWENILQLYNKLLMLEYSPVAALNRTFAFSKVYGKEKGLEEALKLKLPDSSYYHALLGELYIDINRNKAKESYQMALSLTRTSADRDIIQKKIDSLEA